MSTQAWGPQFVFDVDLVATAIFFYDFLLTFGDEVRCLWKRQFSIVTALFLISRYAAFFEGITRIATYVPWSGPTDRICDMSRVLNEVVAIIMSIVITVFASLRLYILWDRNYAVLAVILTPGLIGTFVMIYDRTHMAVERPLRSLADGYTCTFPVILHETPGLHLGLVQQSLLYGLTSLNLSAFSELLALLFTCIKAIKMRCVLREVGLRKSYAQSLSQEGALYFGYLLGTYAFCILSYYWRHVELPAHRLCACNAFLSTFFCKFILSLRKLTDQRKPSSVISSVCFTGHVTASCDSFVNRVVDNIAAPVSFVGSDTEGDSD